MANSAPASIKPGVISPPAIYSKYIVRFLLKFNDNTIPLTLHINADVAVPIFTGANLILRYDTPADLTGFNRIDRGVIGGGEINFTNRKVQISGPIEGGPKEEQPSLGRALWSPYDEGGHIVAIAERVSRYGEVLYF
jgi:hypothetical protein